MDRFYADLFGNKRPTREIVKEEFPRAPIPSPLVRGRFWPARDQNAHEANESSQILQNFSHLVRDTAGPDILDGTLAFLDPIVDTGRAAIMFVAEHGRLRLAGIGTNDVRLGT